MFKALFKIMINLSATIIQVIVLPINVALTSALPDVSAKIEEIVEVFNIIFNSMGWAIGLLPGSIIATLLFIVTCEIAKHTVFVSTHNLIKVWNVLQKIKFW